MNRKTIIILSSVAVALILIFIFLKARKPSDEVITTKVERGDFDVKVFSSGQLESENKFNIPVPEKLNDRNLRIWSLKITKLVEEGTYVDSGDFVASLDREAVETQIKSLQDEMEKAYTEYQDAKIDSNLNLSNQRDQITNAVLDREEKKIIMDESIYESPSIQKKAKMDFDKSLRKFEQEKMAYQLKKQQEQNRVDRRFINYRQLKGRYDGLEELLNSLDIYAPKKGIITYIKNPWGATSVGTEVGGNGFVATIPDMSNLISRTYINEIDVSKVKEGQKVQIGVDAFPEKKMTGEVVALANIGQAMPNSDARVFEVKIKMFGEDRDLKPAMTTSNIISATTYKDTLFIPSDAVFENDSLQFVYVKKGSKIRKQIVKLGDENENFVLVGKGLSEGDELCLTEPVNAGELELAGKEIYTEILKEREERKKQAEKAQQEFENRQKAMMPPPGGAPQGMTFSVKAH